MMLTRVQDLAGQSAVYGLGNVLTQAIQFLLIPLYTQFLTPTDYGILSLTATFDAIMAILLVFGLQAAATRFHYDYLDNRDEQRAYYGTIWLFLTLVGLALALLVDWQGAAIFRWLFPDTPYLPYGRLALWSTYLTTASVLPLVLFRVREQPRYYILATVSRFLVMTLAIIYFVVTLRQGAIGSLRGRLVASAVFAVPYTLITLRTIRPAFHWDKLKESLAFGLPMIPHQLSGWALSVSDRIVLAHYVSESQIGLYSLGYRVATVLDMILLSVNMAWSPFFFRTAATDPDAPRTFGRLTTYYTAAMLVLCLGTALLARDALALIAQPTFHSAYHVVPVVVLAFLSHGLYFMVVNQLFYKKRTQRLPLYTAISALVNIVLNILTLSRFGIMAAAWNTVVGYTLLFLLTFREANRRYPVPYEYRRLAVLLALAGGVYALGSLVNLGHPALSLAGRLLAVCLFPLALFVFRFFTPREIAGMRLLGTRIARRRERGSAG